MRNSRALTAVFAIADAALIILFLILYLRQDRTAPVVQFMPVNLTYTNTTTDTDLLVGAQALDARDGDVTDRIVIEKVVLEKATGSAIVYYAVSDLSGNVTKSSRQFPANVTYADNSSVTGDIMEEDSGNGMSGVTVTGADALEGGSGAGLSGSEGGSGDSAAGASGNENGNGTGSTAENNAEGQGGASAGQAAGGTGSGNGYLSGAQVQSVVGNSRTMQNGVGD